MKARRYLTWIALVAILILFNLPAGFSRRVKAGLREIIAPFHDVTSGLGYRMRESFAVLTEPGGRSTELEKLQAELVSLRERVRGLEALEQKNAELEQQLGFARKSGQKLVMCEVIARGEASGWWEAVTLNKGETDGVSVNLAVITAAGLVGRTIAVSSHTCDVLLITDRNCNVSARLARTGEFGIVKGQGVALTGDPVVDMRWPVDPCRMDYLAASATIQKGDKVVTSGLGEIFPEGLLIGAAASVDVHKSGLYQIAYVRPAADLGNLRYVFVVKKRAQTGPARIPAANGAARTNAETRL